METDRTSKIPHLMLPFPVPSDKELSSRQFLASSDLRCFGTTTCYSQPIPELRDSSYLGLNHCSWLLVVRPGLTSPPLLFNPLTRSQIPLPPLPPPSAWNRCSNEHFEDYPHCHDDDDGEDDDGGGEIDFDFMGSDFYMPMIHSAVVSSDPTDYLENGGSGELMVVAIHEVERKLVFCRPGDGEWTVVGTGQDPKKHYFCSLAFCQGRCYALSWRSDALFVIDPPSALARRVPGTKNVMRGHVGELVSAGRDLLLLVRGNDGYLIYKLVQGGAAFERDGIEVGSDGEDGKGDGSADGGGDEVEKGRKSKKCDWLKLESIGDHAIFISSDNALTISTKGLIDCEDSIFISDIVSEKADGYSTASSSILKFSMRTKETERVFSSSSETFFLWRQFWFKPKCKVF